MAGVFYGGEAELNLFTAGEPHPSMLQYAREKVHQIGQYIARTGHDFAQGVIDSYNHFYSDEALYRARVATSRVKSFFAEDRITDLTDLYQLQQASPVMQRYIMAEPEIGRLYAQGRCEGYGYVDPFPNQYGEANYNWRRAMQGLAQFQEPTAEAPDGTWKFEIYMEELMEGDRELVLPEQVMIQSSWDRIRYALANSMMDPTSKSGNML